MQFSLFISLFLLSPCGFEGLCEGVDISVPIFIHMFERYSLCFTHSDMTHLFFNMLPRNARSHSQASVRFSVFREKQFVPLHALFLDLWYFYHLSTASCLLFLYLGMFLSSVCACSRCDLVCQSKLFSLSDLVLNFLSSSETQKVKKSYLQPAASGRNVSYKEDK